VGKLLLLDGDRISALFATLIHELCEKAGISLKLRIIQTAYANGASTYYFEKVLNLPVSCTRTGVKYLHREAVEGDHDVAIYFEANGHGTVLFKPQALTHLIQKSVCCM
jgi:phosphoacetylglucosamine mutase